MTGIYHFKDYQDEIHYFAISESGINIIHSPIDDIKKNSQLINIEEYQIGRSSHTSFIHWKDPKISIPLDDFYQAIGSPKYEDSFKIKNISEYLIAIDYYRFISFLIHLEVVFDFNKPDISSEDETKEKDKIADNTNQLKQKINDSFIQTYKTDIQDIADVIENLYKDIVEHLLKLPQNAEVERAKRIYEKGGNFCFYRGVGHTYYKEAPAIYRNNNELEESRWYRSMKQSYQKDLDAIHYLDRIAMLQHFELPTRLLDVTSNPLVALYMAVNNLYVKNDVDQNDYGEIIVYFDELVDNKTYDSNSVLALAALVKLHYEQKEILRGFLKTITDGINKKYEGKNDEIDRLKKLVNYCVHLSTKNRDCDYYFNSHELLVLKEAFHIESLTKPEQVISYIVSPEKNEEKKLHILYNEFVEIYFKLLSTIRRENSSFVDNLDVFMLNKAFHVTVGMTNERMRVQSGSFIICGLDKDYINTHMKSSRNECYDVSEENKIQSISTKGTDNERRIKRLFITDKGFIYKQLNSLNINDMTMFPDMAHQSAYLIKQTNK